MFAYEITLAVCQVTYDEHVSGNDTCATPDRVRSALEGMLDGTIADGNTFSSDTPKVNCVMDRVAVASDGTVSPACLAAGLGWALGCPLGAGLAALSVGRWVGCVVRWALGWLGWALGCPLGAGLAALSVGRWVGCVVRWAGLAGQAAGLGWLGRPLGWVGWAGRWAGLAGQAAGQATLPPPL
jgi:hypothetical protein